jgi:hypothetical protein
MYDAFISCSHAADGRLAPAIQRALHRLARPWYKARAIWDNRDPFQPRRRAVVELGSRAW